MTTTPHPTRLDRANTDAALYRVAICAFTYHPDKRLDEPGYQLAEDLDWCVAPLATLPTAELTVLRETIATMITTPTADRQAFIRTLATLSDDPSEGL
jgi:hypothetical protein